MNPYENLTEQELRSALKLKPTDPLTWCRRIGNTRNLGREHMHFYPQLYYVRRGSALYCADGGTLRLTRGDCVIAAPETVHSFRAEKDSDFTSVSFYMQIFPPLFKDDPCLQRFFTAMFSRALPQKINLSDAELLYMDQLTAFMNDEDEREQEGYKNVLLCILTAILTLLSRAHARKQKQTRHNSAMLDTLEYIQLHFGEELSGAALAGRLFLSESTFYRAFKRMTGHSFQDYLTSTRIFHACRRLREKSLPLAAIAAECGYGDYSAFYRAFVALMHMTPSAYRQRDLPAAAPVVDD